MTSGHDDNMDEDIPDEQEPMPEDGDMQRGGVGELLRRAVLAGVGAVFLTEEGIRRSVTELKLPKEMFSYFAAQAERTRTDAGRVVRKELRRFLNSDAFKQQMAGLLSGLTLEIKAEVRLRPDAQGRPQPDVDASIGVKSKSPARRKDEIES